MSGDGGVWAMCKRPHVWALVFLFFFFAMGVSLLPRAFLCEMANSGAFSSQMNKFCKEVSLCEEVWRIFPLLLCRGESSSIFKATVLV